MVFSRYSICSTYGEKNVKGFVLCPPNTLLTKKQILVNLFVGLEHFKSSLEEYLSANKGYTLYYLGPSKNPPLIFRLYSGFSDKRIKYCAVAIEYPAKYKLFVFVFFNM